MNIILNSVIPKPMNGESFSPNSIWGKECTLDSSKSYFVSSDSGKGKSTLLSFIYGLRTDYSGSLLVDNVSQKNISINDWSELRTRKISFLLQDLKLFGHLTVWENLILKNDLTQHKTTSQIEEMLNQFDLLHKKEQVAETLSLGQQQRVALIRSLLQPFEFLLLDEPFSNIDTTNIEIAKKMINKECKENNAGFILATLGNHYNMNTIETVYL